MKKIGACLLLIGSFLVLSLFTGCQARTVTVDTVLTVDSSWSGSRVMTVAFSAADYPDEQSLEFTSHEDYQKKLEALMGSAPYGVFSHTDSIFFKGTRIYEDFDSAALFAWMLEEPEEKPGFSLQCGKTSVVLDGKALPTPGRITVNQVEELQPVDEISISTVSYGRGVYDRTFSFYAGAGKRFGYLYERQK